MNKREMINELLDKVLEIEESSKKGVRFSYSNSLLSVYFKETDDSGEFIGKSATVFFKSTDIEGQLNDALAQIGLVKNTPDVEPKISVMLTIEKAKELGLIA